MQVTLDQALRRGIEAYKAGQFQEADRVYTAILKAYPKHPDANHNMAVLAVAVGKIEESISFFKMAVETNPSIAQYWFGYLDALIKIGRKIDSENVLDQVFALAENKISQGSLKDVKRLYQDILFRFPKNRKAAYEIKSLTSKLRHDGLQIQDPPEAQVQQIINLYN